MFPHSIPIRINFPRSIFFCSSRLAFSERKNNTSKLPHPLHDINTIIRFSFNLYSASSTAISVSSTDAFIKLRLQVHEIMIPEKAKGARSGCGEGCTEAQAHCLTISSRMSELSKRFQRFLKCRPKM